MEELSMMEDKGTTKSLPLCATLNSTSKQLFFKPCLNLYKKSFSSEMKTFQYKLEASC